MSITETTNGIAAPTVAANGSAPEEAVYFGPCATCAQVHGSYEPCPTTPRRSVLHVGLSVRGALRWPLKNLRNMVSDENGDRLTPRETREWLLDQLSQGVEMLSFGGCDNFDPKTGCRGHDPVSPAAGAQEPASDAHTDVISLPLSDPTP